MIERRERQTVAQQAFPRVPGERVELRSRHRPNAQATLSLLEHERRSTATAQRQVPDNGPRGGRVERRSCVELVAAARASVRLIDPVANVADHGSTAGQTYAGSPGQQRAHAVPSGALQPLT